MELNYNNLRPMDGVCTASSSLVGRVIRLWTAKLKGFNGFKEFGRLHIANHFGYIVAIGNKFWMAEPIKNGLKISSLKEYTNNPKKDKIVSVVRHYVFENPETREKANSFLVEKAVDLVPYDKKGIGSFLGLAKDAKDKWYCSEMGEDVLNQFGGSWDNWQLNREGKKRRIAPVEIQFGNHATSVKDFLK